VIREWIILLIWIFSINCLIQFIKPMWMIHLWIGLIWFLSSIYSNSSLERKITNLEYQLKFHAFHHTKLSYEFRMFGTLLLSWTDTFMMLFEAWKLHVHCNCMEKSDQYNLSKSSLCVSQKKVRHIGLNWLENE